MTTLYLEQQNGQIAYDDTGRGPLVICTPSMGDLRAEYRLLTPLLVAAGYRVITVDVRGHGESSTDWPDFSVGAIGSDLVALIRTLNAGPATIVGTSMAAGAAVWAAAEAPDLVAGLVLIGPFVRGETSWQNRMLYGVLFRRPWGPSLWLRYFATLYPTQKPADFAQYCAALQANLKQTGRFEALSQMMAASKAASAARVDQVTAPTLVLMGTKDPDFKDQEAEAQWVATSLRGRYEMLPDAGHYPHAEMPTLTGSHVLAFLQALPANKVQSHDA